MSDKLAQNSSEKKIISKFYFYTIIIGFFVLVSSFIGVQLILNEFEKSYTKELNTNLIDSQKNFTKQNLDSLIKHLKSQLKANPKNIQQIKETFKKRINSLRFPNNGYVWIHNSNHKLILNPYRLNELGIDDKELTDSKGTKIIQLFVKESLKNPKGTFVKYYWKKPNTNIFEEKISYLVYIKELDWILGTGLYSDDLKKHIDTYKKSYDKKVSTLKNWLIIIFVFTAVLMIYFSYRLSKDIKNKFDQYSKILKDYSNNLQKEVYKKTKELNILNKSLEKRIQKELEINRTQELQILEQSKHAQMGEMIENIAHQWRQPLNVISMRASYIKIQNELGNLKPEDIDKAIKNIIQTTLHLSKTIDIFKNFINKKNDPISLDIIEILNNTCELLMGTMKHYDIKLIKAFENHKPVNIIQFDGELSQVVLNLLNNAKDALSLSENENENENLAKKWIKIDIKTEDKHLIISIEDNAGGIPDEILSKVFDPYFTTKHKSDGTGLGLYMSYKIIKEHFKGNLSVKNSSNGAEFLIKIPLS